jgi:ketosteroid isomerase-like protein
VSERQIEVIRHQYAAVNERDFARAMDLYAEDVVLTVPQSESVQNPGTYEGKKAVGEWFGDWFRTFAADYQFEFEEIRELGEGLIFLVASHGGTGRLSGVEVHGRNAYLYRVRDGKVSHIGFFATREEALEAAELPEWSAGEVD